LALKPDVAVLDANRLIDGISAIETSLFLKTHEM